MAQKKYTPSKGVTEAEILVQNRKNSRPEEYRSAWEEQLKLAMDRILNREPFQYNLNGDALYQQYRDQAIRNGRLAMMDTVGQAAALTGGYGNSYAQTAGQQVYGQQLSELNDRIPELYALAMEQYRRQGDALQQRYDLLYGAEEQDYSRYRDGLSAWQEDMDRLENRYRDARSFDYSVYRDGVKDSQWQADFDEKKRRYDQEWEAAHTEPQIQTVYRTQKAQEPEDAGRKKKQKTVTGTGPMVRV